MDEVERLRKACAVAWRDVWAESAGAGWHVRTWFDEDVIRNFENGTVAEAIARHLDPTDSFDAAWHEAEAALPEGWELMGVYARVHESAPWGAQAQTRSVEPLSGRSVYVGGPTPAAALRALAAKLRERQA